MSLRVVRKPHIRQMPNPTGKYIRYMCQTSRHAGFGRTPALAYRAWVGALQRSADDYEALLQKGLK